MGVHTNDHRSGRKEPDFRRHSFTQLLGMLATENSYLSSSLGVGLCRRDFLEQVLVSQGHKDCFPFLKSGLPQRSILALVSVGLAETSAPSALQFSFLLCSILLPLFSLKCDS